MLTTTHNGMYNTHHAQLITQSRETWPQADRFERSGWLLHGSRVGPIQNDGPTQHCAHPLAQFAQIMKSALLAQRPSRRG